MMSDNQEPILSRERPPYTQPAHTLKSFQWWALVVANILFLVIGQAAAVLLGRYYYDKGGKSKWMATLVQTAAFPILLIPYFTLHQKDHSAPIPDPPSPLLVSAIYFLIGVFIAGDNMLYSVALLYLSASTYSLICATQLAFNAVFSYFINRQKFTALIFNSVVILSLSAALLAINDDSSTPEGVSKGKYVVGVITALAASALYALLLSLMQLTFEKVLRKETFGVVLEMQVYTALVATLVSVVGLFASGEWRGISGEMGDFGAGKLAYVMALVWTAVSWQVCSVGVLGLIYVVSSLFSNVISTLSLAVTPLAALVVFRDGMNGVKVIAMLMAFWGFASYTYQNYLDDVKARKEKGSAPEEEGGGGEG